jgi:hypothetical protein
MEKHELSRSYLETLSTADLISLADDYDIDIPVELNRRFIIGELLDVADELQKENKNEMIIASSAGTAEDVDKLPESYNETRVDVLLRNPAWAYVYWDIKEADRNVSDLLLSVQFYGSKDDEKYSDVFEVQIARNDREQYVLLPAGKRVLKIDLVGRQFGKLSLLASSRKIEIPRGSELLLQSQPGKKHDISPILKLSGIEQLLSRHYLLHRQAF